MLRDRTEITTGAGMDESWGERGDSYIQQFSDRGGNQGEGDRTRKYRVKNSYVEGSQILSIFGGCTQILSIFGGVSQILRAKIEKPPPPTSKFRLLFN